MFHRRTLLNGRRPTTPTPSNLAMSLSLDSMTMPRSSGRSFAVSVSGTWSRQASLYEPDRRVFAARHDACRPLAHGSRWRDAIPRGSPATGIGFLERRLFETRVAAGASRGKWLEAAGTDVAHRMAVERVVAALHAGCTSNRIAIVTPRLAEHLSGLVRATRRRGNTGSLPGAPTVRRVPSRARSCLAFRLCARRGRPRRDRPPRRVAAEPVLRSRCARKSTRSKQPFGEVRR